jgi:hypothetical protein
MNYHEFLQTLQKNKNIPFVFLSFVAIYKIEL